MYGKAKGLKVKMFTDYTDGDVEDKLNKFFSDNPEIEVVDVKLEFKHDYSYEYGNEYVMVFYR